jgi:hypothetical protein
MGNNKMAYGGIGGGIKSGAASKNGSNNNEWHGMWQWRIGKNKRISEKWRRVSMARQRRSS